MRLIERQVYDFDPQGLAEEMKSLRAIVDKESEGHMCLRSGLQCTACPRLQGGLRIIQHNEVRDTIAQCMNDAGHTTVELEPQLQEAFISRSANTQDEARSDIKCCGFWGNRLRQAYFDVKVVSPFARSNSAQDPAQLFKTAERQSMESA